MSFGSCRIWLVVIAMTVAAGPVSASEAPALRPPTTAPASETWPKLFAELASADLQTRDTARITLMRLTRADLPAVRDMVVKSRPILPAQAAALHEIVQEIYLAGEKYETTPQQGFLGIMMDELPRADLVPENDLHRPIGVIVADRIPGFCAARNLISGDIILGIASPFTPFRSMEDLKNAVGGSPPGTVVGLLILRRGQVMRVMLTLDAKPIDALLLDAGVNFRAERQKKFDAYWQSTFKPLLVQQLG